MALLLWKPLFRASITFPLPIFAFFLFLNSFIRWRLAMDPPAAASAWLCPTQSCGPLPRRFSTTSQWKQTRTVSQPTLVSVLLPWARSVCGKSTRSQDMRCTGPKPEELGNGDSGRFSHSMLHGHVRSPWETRADKQEMKARFKAYHTFNAA